MGPSSLRKLEGKRAGNTANDSKSSKEVRRTIDQDVESFKGNGVRQWTTEIQRENPAAAWSRPNKNKTRTGLSHVRGGGRRRVSLEKILGGPG